MLQNRNLILAVLGFFVIAVVVALFAGFEYAIVALLVGAMCVGGVAVASFVAVKADAPFSPDESTEAGDSSQHSNVSSAVQHAPR